MSDSSVKVLFDLLRIALSEDDVCAWDYCDVDWQEVYELAVQQDVSPVAFDGLIKVYESFPELDLGIRHPEFGQIKYDWTCDSLSSETEYSIYCSVVAKLSRSCAQHGVPLLLLKGYGLSLNYPVPSHRNCGDIDVFPVGASMWNALNLLKGLNPSNSPTSEKHSSFVWNGITVENHCRLLDGFVFNAEKKAEEILEPQSLDELDFYDGYYFLKPVKNWFYLICHMANHFCADGELSLRQFLDLALHLDRHRDKIRIEEGRQWMTATGYDRINDIFVSIASSVSGISLQEFIFGNVHDRDLERVMEVVLSRDRKRDLPNAFFSRILYKFRRIVSNLWKFRYLPMTIREQVRYSVKFHLRNPNLV